MWRESLIIFAMVVFTAYAAALILDIVISESRPDHIGGTADLAAGLLLLAIALGSILRSSANSNRES